MVDYSDEQLDRVFKALGDRTRRQMLDRLLAGEATISELGGQSGLTKQAVSKHIQVLQDAQLIHKRKDGRLQRCVVDKDTLAAAYAVVARYRRFWESQFDELERYLHNEEEKK